MLRIGRAITVQFWTGVDSALAVAGGPLPRAFGALFGVAGLPTQSQLVSTQRRPTRRATFASAHHRQDRGSTSSMSAAIVPSVARTAGSASGSNAGLGRAVRPAAASFVRPRNAGARPRAVLPAARTARRPSPASSPPWPSTPTFCPAASACGSSCSRSGCRRSRAACGRRRSPFIACWSSSTSCPSWERCNCRA